MDTLSRAEENYLKTIYHIAEPDVAVSTRLLANHVQAKDSSVTDMLKKLSKKQLIHYEKYKGVSLTDFGKQAAIEVIRRHRLWEVFLVEKLRFRWDEVHDLAEQLEHIQSRELTNRLEEYLEYPELDPHGDPIPNREGQVVDKPHLKLSQVHSHHRLTIVRVKDDSAHFLSYLNSKGIGIGDCIHIVQREVYDGSIQLKFSDGRLVHISSKVSDNILVIEN